MTLRELHTSLAAQLTDSGNENAGLEARFLMEDVFGMTGAQLRLHGGDAADEALRLRAEEICGRRCKGEPLQYLLGTWEFFGMTFAVGAGVLVPRADTEVLVEAVLRLTEDMPSVRLLDLCSGSGCIPAAIAQYRKIAAGHALEKSPEAMHYLRRNLLRLAPEISPVLCDVLLEETAAQYQNYDIITSNPPYLTEDDMLHLQREVTFEPSMALYGGNDGLDFYRKLAPLWRPVLHEGGWLLFEVGAGQSGAVSDILRQSGYAEVQTVQDYAGIERVVMGRRVAQ